MKCCYVKQTGIKASNIRQRSYYICHRSYVVEKYKNCTETKLKKCAKSSGSVKEEYSCTSNIKLIKENGRYKATLFTPHIGHECTLKHINLSDFERAQIAGRNHFLYTYIY